MCASPRGNSGCCTSQSAAGQLHGFPVFREGDNNESIVLSNTVAALGDAPSEGRSLTVAAPIGAGSRNEGDAPLALSPSSSSCREQYGDADCGQNPTGGLGDGSGESERRDGQ